MKCHLLNINFKQKRNKWWAGDKEFKKIRFTGMPLFEGIIPLHCSRKQKDQAGNTKTQG